jgi:hypothetical protein
LPAEKKWYCGVCYVPGVCAIYVIYFELDWPLAPIPLIDEALNSGPKYVTLFRNSIIDAGTGKALVVL